MHADCSVWLKKDFYGCKHAYLYSLLHKYINLILLVNINFMAQIYLAFLIVCAPHVLESYFFSFNQFMCIIVFPLIHPIPPPLRSPHTMTQK